MPPKPTPGSISPQRARLARQLIAQVDARGEHVGLVERRCFDKQIAFIRDASRRKVLFTPRRVGKTTACALYLLEQALLYPGRKSLFIGLSGEAAQRTAYDEVIRPELERMGIAVRWHGQARLLTLPNKSSIKFFGMDSAPSDQDRVLGGKYHLVIVDECQGYQQDMRCALEEKVAPALADYASSGGGVMVLAGTPGLRMGKHFWWQMTRQHPDGSPDVEGRTPGWKMFGWHVGENPHMAEEFAAECARLREVEGPDYQTNPAFRRQWLGQWVQDVGARVYKFDEAKNVWGPGDAASEREQIRRELLGGLQVGANGRRWTYVLACDLGWEDATAIVVGAYCSTIPRFFVVASEKHSHSVISTIGARLLAYRQRYNIARMVLDTGGGGRQIAESLVEQFRLPIFAATKTEKENHIGRMNSDFLAGRIVVVDREASAGLINEWDTLVIDRRKWEQGVWKESEAHDNHLADAALYAWRDSSHHMVEEQEKTPLRTFADEAIARLKRATAQLTGGDGSLLEQRVAAREARRVA